MSKIDLRQYKNELRSKAKEMRINMDKAEKAKLDAGILNNILKMREFNFAETVLVYVSTDIEIDTFEIIKAAWERNKKVAVPRCIPETREMEFHYIETFDDLKPGTFSVLEPDENAPILRDFSKSIMFVPAMVIDKFGYRIGYGKGYYDRYISRYTGITVGLCYLENLKYKIFHGKFDRKLGFVITEKYIKKTYI